MKMREYMEKRAASKSQLSIAESILANPEKYNKKMVSWAEATTDNHHGGRALRKKMRGTRVALDMARKPNLETDRIPRRSKNAHRMMMKLMFSEKKMAPKQWEGVKRLHEKGRRVGISGAILRDVPQIGKRREDIKHFKKVTRGSTPKDTFSPASRGYSTPRESRVKAMDLQGKRLLRYNETVAGGKFGTGRYAKTFSRKKTKLLEKMVGRIK